MINNDATPVLGIATAKEREAIDALLASPEAKQYLPSNLKLRWSVKPTPVNFNDTVTKQERQIDTYQSSHSAPPTAHPHSTVHALSALRATSSRCRVTWFP